MKAKAKARPVIVLRPDWGGPFAWMTSPVDGAHDVVGCADGAFAGGLAGFRRRFGVSKGLVRDLGAWQREYDRMVDSGDSSPERSRVHLRPFFRRMNERGIELARRLKAEVGDNYGVAVSPIGEKWREVGIDTVSPPKT